MRAEIWLRNPLLNGHLKTEKKTGGKY